MALAKETIVEIKVPKGVGVLTALEHVKQYLMNHERYHRANLKSGYAFKWELMSISGLVLSYKCSQVSKERAYPKPKRVRRPFKSSELADLMY